VNEFYKGDNENISPNDQHEEAKRCAEWINQTHPTILFTKAPSYWIRSVPYIAGVQRSHTELNDQELIAEAKRLGFREGK